MATTITWGNPYTHEEHSRTTYTRKDFLYTDWACSWCGQRKPRLYGYDGRPRIFCDKQCYQAFYS